MRAALILALFGLTALMACDRKPAPIGREMAPKLQALATSACRCEQSASTDAEKTVCWQAYEDLGKGSKDSEFADACAPVSAGGDGYNSDTPQAFNINTGWSSPVGKLCTAEEVKAVETAWQTAFDAGQSGTVMDVAMQKALKDLQSGRQVAMTGGGCGG